MNRSDRYFCSWPECGRSYSKPSKLAEHYRSHTNDVRNKEYGLILLFFRDALYVTLKDVERVFWEKAIYNAISRLVIWRKDRFFVVLTAVVLPLPWNITWRGMKSCTPTRNLLDALGPSVGKLLQSTSNWDCTFAWNTLVKHFFVVNSVKGWNSRRRASLGDMRRLYMGVGNMFVELRDVDRVLINGRW